jgi:hypothetical protein
MVIRTEQMREFERVTLRRFEDEMVCHASRFARRHCEAIGEESVRQTVRLGIREARRYELTARGPVRFYIEMMFLFGSAFTTDPQVPWAGEILNSRESGEMERADRLHEKAMDYLDKVVGADGGHALCAMQALAAFTRRTLPLSERNFRVDLLAQLHRLYPEKCAYVGRNGLESLVGEAIDRASTFQFSTVRAITLMVVLMFALGHGVAEDPLFPWISRTLGDPLIVDSTRRAIRLERKMTRYLERVLASAGRA